MHFGALFFDRMTNSYFWRKVLMPAELKMFLIPLIYFWIFCSEGITVLRLVLVGCVS